MDFNKVLIKGLEVIPSYLHNEWIDFIEEQQNLNQSDLFDSFEICSSIVYYLMKFKELKSGKVVAKEFYEQYNYKNNYAKKIANYIATFSAYPENIKFIQAYFELFVDITNEEENALTEKIKELKTRNEIINACNNYEEIKDLGKKHRINLDINGQIIPLIEWENEFYRGVNENGEIAFYTPLSEDYDLLYLINEDGTYTRFLSKQHKLTENGMTSDKTLLTNQDNSCLGIENFSILKNPNFYDIKQTIQYYQKIENKIKQINRTTLFHVMKEANEFKKIFIENKSLDFAIFEKISQLAQKHM